MSLVGWWPFDGSTEDKISNNNGAGLPNYVDGKIDQAIEGDGTSITVSNSGDIKSALTGNQMTLSVWWKQDDHTDNEKWADIISSGGFRLERGNASGSSNADYWCNFGSGDSDFRDTGLNISKTDIGIPSGKWFHIVARRIGETLEIWINGELNASGTTTKEMEYGSDLQFNTETSGSQIDDIRLYDHAISEKEITQLAQAKTLHYKFNQDGVVTDATGHGNTGTVNGATYISDSKVGSGAYQFDGSNDNIDVPPESVPTGTEITISFWSYGADSQPTDNSAFEATDSGSNRVANIHLPWGNGSVYWDTDNGGSGTDRISKSANSSDFKGRWTHWTFTKNADTGNQKIYLDGELWHSGSNYTGNLATTTSAKLGSHDDGSGKYYPGKIDDFRIYATELSKSEIQTIYQQRASIDSGGNLSSHKIDETSSGVSLTEGGKFEATFSEVGPDPDSLAAWWPLDGNTKDYSGSGNHGANNGATITGGLGQSAYEFNGVDNWINIDRPVRLDSSLTISFWMKLYSVGDGNPWPIGLASSNNSFNIQYNNYGNKKVIFYEGENGITTDSTLELNTWYFVVCVYDKNNKSSIYINGTLDSSTQNNGSTSSASWGNSIATKETDFSKLVDGALFDFRIYDRALTDAEIKTLYKLTDVKSDQQLMQRSDGVMHSKNKINELL